MLDMITLGWPDLAPSAIVMDYEKSLMNAFGAYFPDAQIHGCFFNLVQNMKKHLTECGLGRRHRQEPDFELQAKMISAIAFIPPPRIEEALRVLHTSLDPALEPVLDYFEENYIGRLRLLDDGTFERREPFFPVSMWTVYQRTIDREARTNNYVEAFHRSLQRQFAVDHPGSFKFIDGLRIVQHNKDAQLERYIAGNEAPRKRNEYIENDIRIMNILNRLGTRPIADTLRGLARTYDMDP